MKHMGLRLVGLLLFLLAIVGLIATTSLSISGGSNEYTNINKLFNGQTKDYLGIFRLSGFVIGTIFIQLMIFAVSSIETFIKIKFNRHFLVVVILQIGLLVVSIYYNYRFFGSNSFIKLLLCILLDLSVIKLVSLSMDLMTLNYSIAGQKESSKSIFKMWLDNKFFGLKDQIVKTYNANNNLLVDDIKEDIKVEDIKVLDNTLLLESSDSKSSKTKTKIVDFKSKNYSKIKNYLVKNYTENERIRKFQNAFNLSLTEYRKILEQLKEDNIIYTQNKNTYLSKQNKIQGGQN